MAVIENVIVNGDLSQLSPGDRVMYYNKVCESAKLNPLTRPFEYIRLNGKLTLYARKDCTDQLRSVHSISIKIVSRERIDDVYIVTAQATNRDGRYDESTGAVSVGGLRGDALANAYLKAETKAKRRVTLSLAGLGLLDEQEVETIPNAEKVDFATGEVIPAITSEVDIVVRALTSARTQDDKMEGVSILKDLNSELKTKVWGSLNNDVKEWIKSLNLKQATA